jgi:hypothetical protein
VEGEEEVAKHINEADRFASRVCEFFCINEEEEFQIWNLQKSVTKPAHVIKFQEKHQSE